MLIPAASFSQAAAKPSKRRTVSRRGGAGLLNLLDQLIEPSGDFRRHPQLALASQRWCVAPGNLRLRDREATAPHARLCGES